MKTMKKILVGLLVVACMSVLGTVMGTTVDETVGGYGWPAGTHKGIVLSGEVNFTTGETNTNMDVFQLIKIPSNTYVMCVWYQVTSNSTTWSPGATFCLGDGDSTNRYLAATSVAGLDAGAVDTTANLYTSDDTIDMRLESGGIPTNYRFRVKAFCVPFDPPEK